MQFSELYLKLKEQLDTYLSGGLTAEQLKPFSAQFGVYEQRNGLFMVRIRIPGGDIDAAKLLTVAKIMKRHQIEYAHLSTRQDIQLQNVRAEDVYWVILACSEAGMPFRGGGANTLRNIMTTENSGFSAADVFDVQPHARALNQFILNYDKAFALPRKFKIGFFSGKHELHYALVQDVGFVATVSGGRKGFTVYGGGGMGRESALGLKLFDFIPENEFIRCAVAMTDLFYDHGDRTNRSRARVRFIVKNIGEEAFIELYRKYFAQTPAYEADVKQVIYSVPDRKSFERNDTVSSGFDLWRQYAVASSSQGKDIKTVRLYVPYGNLTAGQLEKIVLLTERYGAGFVRLARTQDILLPLVHESVLPELFAALNRDFTEIDLVVKSFRGHIVSCVGSEVCKIGVLNSPAIAEAVAAELDGLFEHNQERKAALINRIIDAIKISGCPNSCGAHPIAELGLQGQKKRINDKLEEVCMIFRTLSPLTLGVADENPKLVADIPALVRKYIANWL
ncbi:MAG: nitrite/sulfite reductase [Victivallaceae bacterium]